MSVSLSGEFDECQLVNLPSNKTYVIIFFILHVNIAHGLRGVYNMTHCICKTHMVSSSR